MKVGKSLADFENELMNENYSSNKNMMERDKDLGENIE